MGVRSEIVEGIAEILWAEGWMNHVEEHGCEQISGRNIIDVMPPIPKDALEIAEKWAAEVEKLNGKKLDVLYDEAMEANEREGKGSSRHSSPTAFGDSLAYMIQGAGVDWSDYNAEFEFKYPSHEGGDVMVDLMYLAGSKCKAAWENPPCKECGAFSRPGKKKCSNCGEPRPEDEER